MDTVEAAAVDTRLDQLVGAAERERPGQSAFKLVSEGPEAFALRVRAAQLAERSLDVQTYIWHADLTGRYLAGMVLAAADRGVRVRVLVDDLDARAKNDGFAALHAHPGIDVRVFNPFVSRKGFVFQAGEFLTGFGRLNHRMHNKSWIADNRFAIAGGRNLGDEYFGASEDVNFADLDFAMIGPVVREASASFDRYWNSAATYPMDVLDAPAVNTADLDRLRSGLAAERERTESSHYATELRNDDALKRLLSRNLPMEWSDEYRFVADDPLKALKKGEGANSNVVAALSPVLVDSSRSITLISPYFVPGRRGAQGLVDAVAAGKAVRILTNSLAANDVAAVHGGYSRYRKTLARGGVQLWELKPITGEQAKSSFRGSKGASLHSKALTVDGRIAFVGSYNLDPRSTTLNTEQGVLVSSEALAAQLEALFERQTAPAGAWRVTADGRGLSWSDDESRFRRDPIAGIGRRFQAWFARFFRLDAQL